MIPCGIVWIPKVSVKEKNCLGVPYNLESFPVSKITDKLFYLQNPSIKSFFYHWTLELI